MNWQPGEDIGLRLDNVGEGATTQEDIDAMLAAINEVAAAYGFKIRQYGEWSAMRQSMADELRHTQQGKDK